MSDYPAPKYSPMGNGQQEETFQGESISQIIKIIVIIATVIIIISFKRYYLPYYKDHDNIWDYF